MTYEEIFSNISAHMIKGIMFHAQMADYFDFLGLKGYKRLHEYHYFDESIMFRKLSRYYINNCSRLIDEQAAENPHSIPESWHRYQREDVDVNTKRSATKTAFQSWVDWENGTLKMYEKAYTELIELGEIALAMFIKAYMCDVEKELKCARRMNLDLKSIDYDMSVIVHKQEKIHEKYKEKTENICFDFSQY